jgi:hypothetical protein
MDKRVYVAEAVVEVMFNSWDIDSMNVGPDDTL